jgi:SAM-dependent methyltransferase
VLSPDTLAALLTEEGAALLARAAALGDDPFAAQKLRAHCDAAVAAAAVEQVRLRRRAAPRFSRAAEMWFAPDLLEQASGEVIAGYRAARYPPDALIADLCCGLGGDTAALAARGPVVAVDRDPLALALTEANARALGLAARVRVVAAELPGGAPPADLAWLDPGRREGGRRTRSLTEMSPDVDAVRELAGRYAGLGVKLSPATADGDVSAAFGDLPHERMFVSVGGECRELAVWLGSLIRAAPGVHRAVLLPQGLEIAGEPAEWPAPAAVDRWLLEPDGAVIRAGLVGNLAEGLGLAPLDPRLAYLTGPRRPETGLGTAYEVLESEPFSGKFLAARLRTLRAGDVVLKTRGFAAEPEALRRSLRPVLKQGDPAVCPTVFLTRVGGRAVMIVGARSGA